MHIKVVFVRPGERTKSNSAIAEKVHSRPLVRMPLATLTGLTRLEPTDPHDVYRMCDTWIEFGVLQFLLRETHSFRKQSVKWATDW